MAAPTAPKLSDAIVGDMDPQHQRGLHKWVEFLHGRHDEIHLIFTHMDEGSQGASI
jgi:hypothetical protein